MLEKEPMLEDLSKTVENTEKEFNFAKVEVLEIRNREKSTQEQLNRAKLMLERLLKPQVRLQLHVRDLINLKCFKRKLNRNFFSGNNETEHKKSSTKEI